MVSSASEVGHSTLAAEDVPYGYFGKFRGYKVGGNRCFCLTLASSSSETAMQPLVS